MELPPRVKPADGVHPFFFQRLSKLLPTQELPSFHSFRCLLPQHPEPGLRPGLMLRQPQPFQRRCIGRLRIHPYIPHPAHSPGGCHPLAALRRMQFPPHHPQEGEARLEPPLLLRALRNNAGQFAPCRT